MDHERRTAKYEQENSRTVGHRSAGGAFLVVGDVEVEEAADHLLVLGMALPGLLFEEIHGSLTQPDSDFDLFFVKRQLIGGRQKIINDPDITQGLIRIFYWLLHRSSFPFASSLHQ